MPQLPPEWYLSKEDLLLLQQLETELRALLQERQPLAAKLFERTQTREEMAEIVRLNKAIAAVTAKQQALLSKNPLRAENL